MAAFLWQREVRFQTTPKSRRQARQKHGSFAVAKGNRTAKVSGGERTGTKRENPVPSASLCYGETAYAESATLFTLLLISALILF